MQGYVTKEAKSITTKSSVVKKPESLTTQKGGNNAVHKQR